MNVIRPNDMGYHAKNLGVEGIKANYGHGVAEVKNKIYGQQPNVHLHNERKAKAREFGRQIHEVGF